MIDQKLVREIMEDNCAVITDSHVVYTSGRHGSAYVNKDAIYPHTSDTLTLCKMLATAFERDDADVVIAPAVGGVILSQWTAFHLTVRNAELQRSEVLSLYADKTNEGFVIKRGYDKFITDKRVLVVEDVVNTGGSVKKVVDAVRECGGVVIGVGALCNRGGITAEQLGVPKLVALMDMTLEAWDEAGCPLCKRDVPVNTDVGKGREFLENRMLYTV